MPFESLALPLYFLLGIILLIIWSGIWRTIALWKAGRNNQLKWFIFLFIINTAGVLEIIYLLFFQGKR